MDLCNQKLNNNSKTNHENKHYQETDMNSDVNLIKDSSENKITDNPTTENHTDNICTRIINKASGCNKHMLTKNTDNKASNSISNDVYICGLENSHCGQNIFGVSDNNSYGLTSKNLNQDQNSNPTLQYRNAYYNNPYAQFKLETKIREKEKKYNKRIEYYQRKTNKYKLKKQALLNGFSTKIKS
jgi:hypothetical protein